MNTQDLAKSLYGMTTAQAIKENVCINCKQKPKFYSKEGMSKYRISALCERCFDMICQESEDASS